MKILLTAVLLFLTATTQAGVTIQHWVTPSGARAYFVENHNLPILDVEVDFAAGAAFDPPRYAGLSALTLSLLNAGAGALNEEQLAARQADLGAQLDSSVDFDRASVHLRTLASAPQREGALELLRLILTEPTFPADILAREKTRTRAAIEEEDTHPDALAAKRFNAAIYPNHPYGVSATTDSIAAINRTQVVDFYRQFYTAHNASIALIGDISRAQAEAIAQRLTAALPPGHTPAVLPPIILPQASRFDVPFASAQQSQIHLGLPAVARGEADYFPLLVGNYTLGGGGFVSRLMKEVREKRGLAYDVHSYFLPRKLAGPFDIGLQTQRAQTSQALKVVYDTLDQFLAKGPTAAELASAKKHLVDSLALRIDSNAKLLGYVSVIGFYGLPLTYLDDFAGNVNAVSLKQVRAAFAHRVDPQHLVTVVVGGD